MTIPNQTPLNPNNRGPSLSSSLPPARSPFGLSQCLPNLTQQAIPTYHSNSSPPYRTDPLSLTDNSSIHNIPTAGGLVTANNGLPPPPVPPILNSYQPYNNNNNTVKNSDEPCRPLNVVDALAYLDQVKGRFANKPNIYNQFLDIMKDFKSQSIDTPGVIERVSTLFKGNPTLISGFNTFLPPGYRIDCEVDPQDPNRIIVTAPNGHTTTSTTTTSEELLKLKPISPHNNNGYHNQHNHQHHVPVLPPHPPTTPLPPSPNASTTIPPTPPNNTQEQQQNGSDKKPAIEFNHAITYVNKIKNRFANDPEVYKQFLKILQTYQKEQKPIGEVYSHVRYLFNGAEDLLEEFEHFLPDTTQQEPLTTSAFKKRRTYTKKSKAVVHEQDEDVIMIITPPPFDPQKPTVSFEELELFEKIKKHIGTKPSYEEFLKTLNLFTQQIVDMDTLVVQVTPFLGNNKDLFDTFKRIIGYEPTEYPIKKPRVISEKPDLNNCEAVVSSPSYRVVPKEWQNQSCSGRDQLCWEVLNDEYVSHPIWASEDSSSSSSKRNIYEEALHRCEEERYEYDLNIEANLNSIALLEPIALSIENMTSEQRNSMRLKPGLGGQTVSIYERIIKKVYDGDRGVEIIDMLYERPASVVPVLLKRLKAKDQEWKKAQREWNKIWRDMDDKNFYRSLDYQSSSFKANEKKTLSSKALVAEIESLAEKISPQFTLDLHDMTLFTDITGMILTYMDHQAGFVKGDREKVRKFLASFAPTFFLVEVAQVEDMHVDQTEDEEMSTDSKSRSSSPRSKMTNGNMSVKSIYTFEKENEMDNDHVVMSGNSERQCTPEADKSNHFPPSYELSEQKQNATHSLICNLNYFCLFRLYQILHERLGKLKSMEASKSLTKKLNQTAVELDLYSNRFEDIDCSMGHYKALLDTIKNFLSGDTDQATFEENVRYIYGVDGYIIYTLDKMIQTLIKQIQVVTTDAKSVEFRDLFINTSFETRDYSSYRNLAEKVLEGSDENMYKIKFDMQLQQMSIQLLTKSKCLSQEDLYGEYMANYIEWNHNTKGIELSQLKPSFLSRNLRSRNVNYETFVQSHLRYKIHQKSYHLYYIVGSEDVFYTTPTLPSSTSMALDMDTVWHQRLKLNDQLTTITENMYK